MVVRRDSVRVSGDGGDGGEAPDEAVVRDRGDGAADRPKENGDGVWRLGLPSPLLVGCRLEAGLGGVGGEVGVVEGHGRQILLKAEFKFCTNYLHKHKFVCTNVLRYEAEVYDERLSSRKGHLPKPHCKISHLLELPPPPILGPELISEMVRVEPRPNVLWRPIREGQATLV